MLQDFIQVGREARADGGNGAKPGSRLPIDPTAFDLWVKINNGMWEIEPPRPDSPMLLVDRILTAKLLDWATPMVEGWVQEAKEVLKFVERRQAWGLRCTSCNRTTDLPRLNDLGETVKRAAIQVTKFDNQIVVDCVVCGKQFVGKSNSMLKLRCLVECASSIRGVKETGDG